MGLGDIIGHKIMDIEVVEYDLYGDMERVGELYRFTLDDRTQHYFFVNGGDCGFYGTLFSATVFDDGRVEGINADDNGKYLGEFRSIINE